MGSNAASTGLRSVVAAGVERGGSGLPPAWSLPDGVSVQTAEGADVVFAGRSRTVGDMTVATTTQGTLHLSVSALDLQGMGYLGFVVGGQVEVTAPDGATVVLRPGEALILSDAVELTVEGLSPTRVVHVLTPAARLEEWGVSVRAGGWETRSGSLAGPVAAFASALVERPDGSEPVSDIVAVRVLENLVVSVYGEGSGHPDPRSDQRRRLRRAAIALIDRSFRDATLTPLTIAEGVGVSLRQLQRCFEGSGTSIATEISARRTDNACMLLAAPAARELTIGEIARRSGFSSAFELRSRVRARFGVSPSDVRRSAPTGAPQPISTDGSGPGDAAIGTR